MKFIDFVKQHPDEESCIQHFRRIKEEKGIVCARCGHTSHYWNKAHKSHDCKECGYRTTLRGGNEFCYKTNRRYLGVNLFDRLLVASVEDTW